MINKETEYTGHALAQGAHHRNIPGTPATSKSFAAQAATDAEAETDLGAVAVLGYN